jgi:hypothetical protein
MDRSLYVLLTAIMQSGEPKLLRAAEGIYGARETSQTSDDTLAEPSIWPFRTT